MKPRWKSVWITPAASGAVAPSGIVEARASFGPTVRKVESRSAANPGRNVELAALLANLTASGIVRLFAEAGTMIQTT
jgi:hypothetical protein